MSKRKRVEAWASAWPDGVTIIHGHAVLAKDMAAPHVRTVHLVEADPAAERVVRAGRYPKSATPTHANPFPNGVLVEWGGRYWAPVERMKKGRK